MGSDRQSRVDDRVPVQSRGSANSFAHTLDGSIPRSVGEAAWQGYDADGHGAQSCERLHQRGGFGLGELGYYLARAVDAGRVRIEIAGPASATAPLALPSPDELTEAQQGWENAIGAQLDYINRYHDEFAARERAEADATRLREALEFYAEEGEWLDEGGGVYHPELAPGRDFGYIAAEALALSGGGAANKEPSEKSNLGGESEIRRSGGDS